MVRKDLGLIILFLIFVCALNCFASAESNNKTENVLGVMHASPDELKTWNDEYLNTQALDKPPITVPHGSINLLPFLDYTPVERDQGTCGDCWVWAATGAVEIAHTIKSGINNRLSIQYLNSNYDAGYGPGQGIKWACTGGYVNDFTKFYNSAQVVIPWSNTNAKYVDGDACDLYNNCPHTKMPANQISTIPNYQVRNLDSNRVDTTTVNQSDAINAIKYELYQNHPVHYSYTPIPEPDFSTFWNNKDESTIWYPDSYQNGVNAHALLIVGYDDTNSDPSKWYWLVLNSWGAPPNRPKGTYRLAMNMDYKKLSAGNYVHKFETINVNFQDNFGSVFVNSTPPGASIWVDGVNTSQITPTTLTNQTVGTHNVILKKTNYLDYSSTVTVNKGQTTSLYATLVPSPVSYGSIFIDSIPQGASIWIDGINTNQITPWTLSYQAIGSHYITLRKTGYLDYSSTVTVNQGQTTSLSAILVPVPVNFGSIFVDSSPEGASIRVDGFNSDQVTPATLTHQAVGMHDVSVLKTGYYKNSSSVNVTVGETTYAFFQLIPQLPGFIAASSVPTGAYIFIDGVNTNLITPNTTNGLSVGPHTLSILKSGFKLYCQAIEVQSNITTPVTAYLSKEYTNGSIHVDSSPQGALISLDGKDTGNLTPFFLFDIPIGEHTISLSKYGFKNVSQIAFVAPEDTTPVYLELKPEPMTGSLMISSFPPGAAISLDGINTGKLTPSTIENLNPGNHILNLTKYGYEIFSDQVLIIKGQYSSVNVNLEPELPSGVVAISSNPQGAFIMLDGMNTEEVTPYTFSNVLSGCHAITLTTSGYNQYNENILVTEDKATIVDAILIPVSRIIGGPLQSLFNPENANTPQSNGCQIHTV